jgi:5-methylthioadenosine/S-adenosylhomocysteine deaminase
VPGATLRIENADFVVTVDPRRRIIRNGTVLVRDGRIAAVAPARDLVDTTADRVIDASGMIVTPGLINGHEHLDPLIIRGLFLDSFDADYIPQLCEIRSKMTEEHVHTGTLAALTELVKGGTTTVLNPGDAPHPEATIDAYDRVGIRAIVGVNITDQENSVQTPVRSTEGALEHLAQTLETYGGRCEGRMQAWVMLAYATTYCSAGLAAGARRLADEHQTGLTFHQSARYAQVQETLELHGVRPVEYLERIDALGDNVVLGHAIHLDDNEIEAMVRTGTKAVMCPSVSLRLGFGTTGHGKLPEMLGAGIKVGLGTDAVEFGTGNSLRAAFLAATLYKDARRDTGMISAEEAFELVTIRGAEALAMEAEVGSLELGKKADLVLFDMQRVDQRPVLNPINNLVYNGDSGSVHTVIVEGRVRVSEGRATFVDERAVAAGLQAASDALLSAAQISVKSRWPVEE